MTDHHKISMLALHCTCEVAYSFQNNAVEMDELDRYVNHLWKIYVNVKDFRFLHPYLENDTICFSTRD